MSSPSIGKSLVAAAVAAVLGTTAAQALTPSQISSIPASNYFYSGGGSAEVQAVYWAITQFLNPSSIDVYTDQAANATHLQSLHFLLITGTINASGLNAPPSLSQGTPVAFIYNFNGGSYPNGGYPQATNTNITTFPTLTGLSSATTTGVAQSSVSSLNPDYTFSTSLSASAAPDWGITDEEIALFQARGNLNGTAALTSTQLSNVAAYPLYDALFGVAVTSKLYAQKQNFSSYEVRAILAGEVTNWNQLLGDQGAYVNQPLPAGPIWVIDRGSGSGTKAAGSQYFLSYPGELNNYNNVSTALTPRSVNSTSVANYTSSSSTGTALVTTSNVYQDVKEASSFAEVDDLVNANGSTVNGGRAIAILGLEFPPAAAAIGGVNQYAFAKINGVGVDAGTAGDNINDVASGKTKYSNVVKGSYDFFYQAVAYQGSTAQAVTGPRQDVAQSILANLTTSTIAGATTSTAFPAAVNGILFDPGTAYSGITAPAAGFVGGSRSGDSTAPLSQVFPGNDLIFPAGDPL